MKSLNKFEDYSPVNEEVAEAFGEGNIPGPQEDDAYHLYLGEGWRGAAWNVAVLANMLGPMREAAVEAQLESSLSDDELKAVIWDFILQARNSWSAKKPRVHDSGARMETREEAEARNSLYRKKRSKAI